MDNKIISSVTLVFCIGILIIVFIIGIEIEDRTDKILAQTKVTKIVDTVRIYQDRTRPIIKKKDIQRYVNYLEGIKEVDEAYMITYKTTREDWWEARVNLDSLLKF